MSESSNTFEAPASVEDVETPALLVDMQVCRRNCELLSTQMSAFVDVTVRPHLKSHKCIELAKFQLGFPGVNGVCCAKSSEAIAAIEGGIADVLLANEVIDKRKLDRVAAALGNHPETVFSACVDTLANAADWLEAAKRHGVTVGLLIEVNTGQDRCGVQTAAEAVALGKGIHALDSSALRGVQGYQGSAQHIRQPLERGRCIAGVCAKVREVVALLGEAGLACPVVTGGGTGTFQFEAGSGVYTEVQPGSYALSDADYARNPDHAFQPALLVLAQVVSRNVQGGWCVVDAGLKAHSVDSGMPRLLGRDDVECVNGGDEHFILKYPHGQPLPEVGTKLKLVPGHCDPTVNMHDRLYAITGDTVDAVWRVHRSAGL